MTFSQFWKNIDPLLWVLLFSLFSYETSWSQQVVKPDSLVVKKDSMVVRKDTLKTKVNLSTTPQENFKKDTIKQANEVGALDIASNRGIFISSQDGTLQL
jgi:hypothetical protein